MTDGGLDYTFECVGNIHTMVFIPFIVLLILFLVWLMLPFIHGPLPDALDVLMSLGVGCVLERREHPGSEGDACIREHFHKQKRATLYAE